MWHGYYVAGNWWMWGFGLLFCGGIIVLIVMSLRRTPDRTDDACFPGSERKPIDYLKERYAKGEIDREEYERIKRHLEE